MRSSLERLVSAGFRPAGCWLLVKEGLWVTLDPMALTAQDALYAFVVNSDLTYVGRTNQGLLQRMQDYRSSAQNPLHVTTTNIKNRRNIINALKTGASVKIYVLDKMPDHEHSGLPAGLEDCLIGTLAPLWNGRGAGDPANPVPSSEAGGAELASTLALPIRSRGEDTRLSTTTIVPARLEGAIAFPGTTMVSPGKRGR